MRRNPELKMCLAATSGGHLRELGKVIDGVQEANRFLVTVPSPQSSSLLPGMPVRTVRRIERNPVNLLMNTIEAIRILVTEKPDLIVSTGAGDVLPLMILGAGLGIPVVFVESIARVHKPSLTGRIVRPFADLIMVSWEPLDDAYPGAVQISILGRPCRGFGRLPPSPKVLVLTGTGPRGFNRLLQAIDHLVSIKALSGQVFAQVGESSYVPENCDHRRYLDHQELVQAILESDLVITHDGAGSMAESIAAGKPTIVVPRRSDKGELTYQSEAELATHLAALSWIVLVNDPTRIPEALDSLGSLHPVPIPTSGRDPSDVLREFMESLQSNRRAKTRH